MENFEGNLLFDSACYDKGKLERIHKYATQLKIFTEGLDFETYRNNLQANYACTFALMQIGTISNRMTNELLTQLPIPLRAIISARNASVHGHSTSHKEIIWNEIEKNIPTLITKLNELLLLCDEGGCKLEEGVKK